MARKSAASLSVVAIDRKRPVPPAGLGETGKSLWVEIVVAYPHDHFNAADLPLLENFIRCNLIVNTCNDALADDGIILDGKAHPALAIRDSQLKNMAALATKLRLPVSSRIRSESVSTRPSGIKPWAFDHGLIPGLDRM